MHCKRSRFHNFCGGGGGGGGGGGVAAACMVRLKSFETTILHV